MNLISTALAARDIGCSERTIRRHADKLGIGATLAGTALVFTPEEVQQLRKAVQNAKSGRPKRSTVSERDLPQECCAACRFWSEQDEIVFPDADSKDYPIARSLCRRYTPVSPPDPPLFRLTRDLDWCGEFQPREERPA